MYVYQDGKLYVQHGDNLIGVEIYSDIVTIRDDILGKMSNKFELLTHTEVLARFNCGYKFPQDKVVETIEVEVNDSEPVRKTKTTTRKRTRE